MFPGLDDELLTQLGFLIRETQDKEINFMNQMKIKQGFRIGLHDYTSFKELDNFQFWTALSQNQPAGFLGSVVYDSGLAYLGSFIVGKQFRGKGYGIKIWKFVLSRLKGNNWGLNSTIEQEQNYKKSGFKTQSYGIRYRFKGTNTKYESQFLVDCKEIDFNLLNQYDKQNFPGSRQEFLSTLINQPRCRSVAFMRNNRVQGYGVIRATPFGYKIGPLTADSYSAAVQILKYLRSQVSQQTQIILQTARLHEDVLKLAAQFKMQQVFTYLRMFTNGQPEVFKKKTIYSITSPEFG